MCKHPKLTRLANGWYCPDCKELFKEKPSVQEEQQEEPKPKLKRRTK